VSIDDYSPINIKEIVMPPTDNDFLKQTTSLGRLQTPNGGRFSDDEIRAVNERYGSVPKGEPTRATTVLSRLQDVVDRARKVEGMASGVANQIVGYPPEAADKGSEPLVGDRNSVVSVVDGTTHDLNEILRKIEGDLERIAAAFL
jgi:hypothetical protein